MNNKQQISNTTPENNKQTYEEWKKELIKITAKETGRPEESIKINDNSAREWYNDGVPPYFTFRETYHNENDGI